MRRHLQCAEQQLLPSNITKYCPCREKWISWLILATYENVIYNAGPIRAWSENDPCMNPSVCNPHRNGGYCPRSPRAFSVEKKIRAPAIIPIFTKCCTCHEKWHLSFTKYCAAWTSPNTAPPTKSNCHDWSSSHMKRHLQCAEQQRSPSNITKYCAWREKRHSKIVWKFLERSWNVIYNERPIRAWSEYDPTMSVRNPPRNRGYFSRSPGEFPIDKKQNSRSGYHSNFHQMLHLPRKVTLKLHQILPLPRKVILNFTKYCTSHEE